MRTAPEGAVRASVMQKRQTGFTLAACFPLGPSVTSNSTSCPWVKDLYPSVWMAEKDFYAVETIVSKSEVNVLIPQLKALGAEDIVELPVTKIVP